jgi:predicted NAD/FAD-dependent oxidoreductase
MTSHRDSCDMKPIVIIGAGLAGLAAAVELKGLRLPIVLVDEEPAVGGRWTSMQGAGWLADPAVPWMTSADTTVTELIRNAGLEVQLVALQGPVLRLSGARTSPLPGGPRWALRHGFSTLFDRWMGIVPRPILNTFVCAIRWVPERRAFLFRDGTTGATLLHPVTRRRLEAAAVVLAVPPRRAAVLAAQSRVLLPAAENLAAQPAQPAAAAVFVVPRFEAPWAAMVVEDNWAVRLIVREELKSPTRIDEEKSVLVVTATPAVANARYAKDAIRILYETAREIVPALPQSPLEAHLRGWEEGIRAHPPDDLTTDPPGAPTAVAIAAGQGSPHERLARAGILAAQQVLARMA